MKKITFLNFTVFALFFGLATTEVISERDWIEASFFAAIGILSLQADFRRKTK